MKTEKLTPQQRQAWSDTMSLMGWTAPGFKHLWYKLLDNNEGDYVAVPTKDVPIAATDGRNILINPDTFFKYSLKERVFIGAHEVIHNVYDDVSTLHRMRNQTHIKMHDGREFPYKNDIMQKAMDYRINALLVESKIGSMPADALYDPKIAEGKDSLFDIYGKVYKNDKSNGGGGNGNDPMGDDVMAPGQGTGNNAAGQAPPPRNPQQWAVEMEVARSLEAQRSQGKMSGGLQHMFGEILEPKVPWQDQITSLIHRATGSGNYDWRRPDRRFIVHDCYLPGRTGFGAGHIVIWGDTSGSRWGNDGKEITDTVRELTGILEQLNPKKVTVIWCDATPHHIDELEDVSDLETIKARGYAGGGGTSVQPVYDWINEQSEKPDVFIGFTDGYVSFPPKPDFPVVWASSTTDVKYPYGDVVIVE